MKDTGQGLFTASVRCFFRRRQLRPPVAAPAAPVDHGLQHVELDAHIRTVIGFKILLELRHEKPRPVKLPCDNIQPQL